MTNPDTGHLDRSLLARLRNNDERALNEVIDLYAPLMLNVAAAITGSTDSAEDVVQQVFIRIWDIRASIDSRGSLRAFLLQVVRNQSISALRKENTHQRSLNLLDESDRIRSSHQPPTALETLSAEELLSEIYLRLDELPRRCREIFLLNWRDELTPQEIADALGIGQATVRNQISRATTHLSSHFGAHFGQPTPENR